MVISDPNSPYAAAGHALVACNAALSIPLGEQLEAIGYRATLSPDPYALLIELLEQPMVYDAVVLSLPAIYREELWIIRTIRERMPMVDVLIAHSDGRHAALAEAMRLGATGLIGEEGIHRLVRLSEPPPQEINHDRGSSKTERDESRRVVADSVDESVADDGQPLLSADELRALLAEQPSLPPS